GWKHVSRSSHSRPRTARSADMRWRRRARTVTSPNSPSGWLSGSASSSGSEGQDGGMAAGSVVITWWRQEESVSSRPLGAGGGQVGGDPERGRAGGGCGDGGPADATRAALSGWSTVPVG